MRKIYVMINTGSGYQLAGRSSFGTDDIGEAVSFDDRESAALYIERHGLEKISRLAIYEK